MRCIFLKDDNNKVWLHFIQDIIVRKIQNNEKSCPFWLRYEQNKTENPPSELNKTSNLIDSRYSQLSLSKFNSRSLERKEKTDNILKTRMYNDFIKIKNTNGLTDSVIFSDDEHEETNNSAFHLLRPKLTKHKLKDYLLKINNCKPKLSYLKKIKTSKKIKAEDNSNTNQIIDMSKENLIKIHRLYQFNRIGTKINEKVRHKTVSSSHSKSEQNANNYEKVLSAMKLSKPKKLKYMDHDLNDSYQVSPYRSTTSYNEFIRKHSETKSQSQLRKHMIMNLERSKLTDYSYSSSEDKYNTRNFVAVTNSTCEQSDRIKSKICKVDSKMNSKFNSKCTKIKNNKLKIIEFLNSSMSKGSFSQTTSNLKVRKNKFEENSYESIELNKETILNCDRNKLKIGKKNNWNENKQRTKSDKILTFTKEYKYFK